MNAVESYLRKRGIAAPWRLECGPIEGVECAVVIPALAERAGILGTLRSLAANPRARLLMLERNTTHLTEEVRAKLRPVAKWPYGKRRVYCLYEFEA